MKLHTLCLSLFAMCLGICPASHAQKQCEIFTTHSEQDVPYRIPAIAALPDGTVICVADYRWSGADIGLVKDGRIDLMMRISRDNGQSWEHPFALIEGKGAQSSDFMNVAYGDPCIVADRESSKVLIMSCAGNMSFLDGTRGLHQGIARFYSNDGGRSWSRPEDISESIYRLFDKGRFGPAQSMFIASGRILQSRFVKKGRYHRLYCSVLQQIANGVRMNFVLYSDNFGKSWKVLGGVDNPPIEKDADEAKVEELPDGSILISSRTDRNGRNFNIFRFTNARRAEGRWGKMAHSGIENGGVHSERNACNGELMSVPVTRTSDGKRMHLLLQSLPLGPGRRNVGIYYKALDNDDIWSSPEKLAADWDGLFRVTELGSAYSTMVLQPDSSIGFLYEESTHFKSWIAYTIVYKKLSVEEITGGRYRN